MIYDPIERRTVAETIIAAEEASAFEPLVRSGKVSEIIDPDRRGELLGADALLAGADERLFAGHREAALGIAVRTKGLQTLAITGDCSVLDPQVNTHRNAALVRVGRLPRFRNLQQSHGSGRSQRASS